MIRRRRPPREIAFSFDSFLDVVANVVGIILRLILVAWVGARSYKAFVSSPPAPATPTEQSTTELPEPMDPLAAEMPKRQRELEEARAKWQVEVRKGEEAERRASIVRDEMSAVTARRQQLDADLAAKMRAEGNQMQARKAAVAASLLEVTESARKVQSDLAALKTAPSQKHTLRYRTPISQPLQTEELMFECRSGRVTIIDTGLLLEDMKRRTREKSSLLRSQWQVEDETRTVGAFRAHFLIERQRSPLEAAAGAPPDDRTPFSYGISAWQVVPVDPARGETTEQALVPGSAFRRVIDAIDPQQTAITFWVYPDSFALYRKLRDILHDHDVTVAGRPLPEGHLISFSTKHGSVSRGQ